MSRVKFSKSILLILILLITMLPSVQVKADEVSIAVSPSKVVDEHIDYGQEKEYSFYLANKSTGDSTKTLNLLTTTKVTNEFGEEVDLDLIKSDPSEFSVGQENQQEVKVTVSIPKGVEDKLPSGYYNFYVEFVQKALNLNEGSEQVGALAVPISVFVGSEDDYNKLKGDFAVTNSYLDLGGKPQTFFSICKSYFIKSLNPLNWWSNISDICNRPYFNIGKRTRDGRFTEQVLDLNDDFYVDLSKVATTHKMLMTDRNYVLYNKDDLNQPLQNCKNNGSSINVTLSNNHKVVIECNPNSSSTIFDQIKALANLNPNATLGDLFETIQVPCNKNYYKSIPILTTLVQNEGNMPLTLKGTYSTFCNTSNLIAEGEFISATIGIDDSKEVKTSIGSDTLSKGNYLVKESLTFRKKSEENNYNFKVGEKRKIILICQVIFILLYLVLIILLVKFIKKFIKNKNGGAPDEEENNNGFDDSDVIDEP